MAETKKYLHNLDVENNKVMNLLLNPLTTAQRTTIGGTLGLSDQSYVCYDTDLDQQYFWDGTQWITVGGGGSVGPGTPTQIAFFDTTSSITSDSALYWDNTDKRLGIGGQPYGYKLSVVDSNNYARFGTTAGSDVNAVILGKSTSSAIALMGGSGERKILIGDGATGYANFISYNSNIIQFSYSTALGGALPTSLTLFTPNFIFSTGTNTHTINDIQPVINLTGGTNTLRGYYYHPNVISGSASPNTHIAFENTIGDIIHGNLSGGSTRMVVADSTGKLGTQTIPSGSTSPLTTKGDLYTYDGSANARLPRGLDTQVLLTDSSTATGLRWGTNTAATPTGYYGAWQDNVTQTATVDNTAYAMIYRTVDLSNGVTVVTDGTNLTRITFANTGIYNIQFSAQLQSLSTATEDVTIWLRKNGVDLPATGSVVGMAQRKGPGDPYHTIASWNFVLSVVAGEYYQLMWSTTNHTDVTIPAYSAISPAPTVPSIILTVTQQSGIMAGTGISRGVYSVSSNTSAGSAANVDYVYLVSGTTTITLPTAVGNTNRYTIKRSGTGVVSIATTSGQTIDDSASPITINTQYVSLDLISDGANWDII